MNRYAGLTGHNAPVETICDLRSDTVTKPDDAMRAAMAVAEVGDDVYGEDPSVNRLQETLASMLGKESALFMPSGTQSNLCALMAHCGRGDEIIIGDGYHVFCDEAGGAAVLGSISMRNVPTADDGALEAETISAAVQEDDPHHARSQLLCLENTFGGKAIPLERMKAAAKAGREKGLSVHLDGARFFNAVTSLGCDPKELAAIADSVSICLSKGLGIPAGSVLVGDAETIQSARRHRKILGGSMRQSGILAAAGLHALDHNLAGLVDDHRRAGEFAAALKALDAGPVRHATNMVFFSPAPEHHAPLRASLLSQGIRIGGQSPEIRMVFHRDVDDAALDAAIDRFRTYYR